MLLQEEGKSLLIMVHKSNLVEPKRSETFWKDMTFRANKQLSGRACLHSESEVVASGLRRKMVIQGPCHARNHDGSRECGVFLRELFFNEPSVRRAIPMIVICPPRLLPGPSLVLLNCGWLSPHPGPVHLLGKCIGRGLWI